VSLPVAVTIGLYVFQNCTSLTEVSLSMVQTIGSSAFSHCPNLTAITVDPANTTFTAHDGMLLNKAETALIAYPSASGEITLLSVTEIGSYAFSGCENLTYVSLPVAQTIGNYAFSGCTSLTDVGLPAAPPSISSIFYDTGSDGTITVSVPTGAVSAYTSAWGVDASTPAGGSNTNKYGDNHKAVLITDPTGGPVADPLAGLDGLADAPGGNTASDPVPLTLSGAFTNDSWAATLSVIAASGKYATLDLSACTMSNT
jgi:hypothetical protein